MSSSGYVLLPDRGVVSVSGADARSFLQGLISNDIGHVGADRAAYAALLTPQGKFLFDFVLAQEGDAVLLETERERLDQLLKRLLMYRLRAKIELQDLSKRFAVAALLGPGVAKALELPDLPGACRALGGGIVLIDPRLSDLGARALLPPESAVESLAAMGLVRRDLAAYEQVRIQLGVPDGSRDLPIEKATLLENGFEELNGVDFKKGCFVGQELTARMKYRGLVRKRLMPVTFEGPSPEPGTIIRLGEREVGEMRSGIEGHGLALLRLEPIAKANEEGIPLFAGETRITPLKPEWAQF